MRKNVFFLLLLLLLLLTLSGCGDSIAPETEKVSLTALQYELENQTLDFDNMWFFQQIEEQTGVHVDFDVVKHSDWTNRVNLMFASGRYHDLILRGSLDVGIFAAFRVDAVEVGVVAILCEVRRRRDIGDLLPVGADLHLREEIIHKKIIGTAVHFTSRAMGEMPSIPFLCNILQTEARFSRRSRKSNQIR